MKEVLSNNIPSFCLLFLVVFELTAGYGIVFFKAPVWGKRVAGWFLFAAALFIMERVSGNSGPLFRMGAIIVVMLVAMKVIVSVEVYKDPGKQLPFTGWMVFALGWPGMQPRLFEKRERRSNGNAAGLIRKGMIHIFLGTMILLLMHLFSIRSVATGVLILMGFSLILHFGILNIMAGAWRFFGVNVPELFRSPLQSKSLKEFWGRRWNIAFSEMAAMAVYRPLKKRWSDRKATFVVFLLSGFFHEMAISVPVKAGYGLPMLYFIVQAIAMEMESFLSRQKINILNNRYVAFLWLILWLLLPLPVLFHQPFMNGIIYPVLKF